MARREEGGGRVIVMHSNATGWWTQILARETGRIGHLYSPGAQRTPRPWLPYALDNGAYSYWTKKTNFFDAAKWERNERLWNELIVWAQIQNQKPLWAVVPDVPGNAEGTIHCWSQYAKQLTSFPRALAVQNGMTVDQVQSMQPPPDVIAVGGDDDWKWDTAPMWAAAFPRVHILRCNAPWRLYDLERWGVESCDGTGWNMGDATQSAGLEEWARSRAAPITGPLWPHLCKESKNPAQRSFA